MSTDELRRRLGNSDAKWQNLYAEVKRRDSKGDRFREMSVPVLEYVGVQSASWESLCLRAAAWANVGPEKGWITDEELIAFGAGPVKTKRAHFAVAGLALFARLMATVTREA